MNPQKLLDWRKLLIYSHRWLGIFLGLVFLAWFVSGPQGRREPPPRPPPGTSGTTERHEPFAK